MPHDNYAGATRRIGAALNNAPSARSDSGPAVFAAIAQAEATLALVDAVRELTEAAKTPRPIPAPPLPGDDGSAAARGAAAAVREAQDAMYAMHDAELDRAVRQRDAAVAKLDQVRAATDKLAECEAFDHDFHDAYHEGRRDAYDLAEQIVRGALDGEAQS